MKTKNIIKIELVGEIFYKKRHRVNFKNRTVLQGTQLPVWAIFEPKHS